MRKKIFALALGICLIPISAYAADGRFIVSVDIDPTLDARLAGEESFVVAYETIDGRSGTITIPVEKFTSPQYATIQEGDYFIDSITCINDTTGLITEAGYGCNDYFHVASDDAESTSFTIAVGYDNITEVMEVTGNVSSVNYEYEKDTSGYYQSPNITPYEEQSTSEQDLSEQNASVYQDDQYNQEYDTYDQDTYNQDTYDQDTYDQDIYEQNTDAVYDYDQDSQDQNTEQSDIIVDETSEEHLSEERDVLEDYVTEPNGTPLIEYYDTDSEEEIEEEIEESNTILETLKNMWFKLAICAIVLIVGLVIIYILRKSRKI